MKVSAAVPMNSLAAWDRIRLSFSSCRSAGSTVSGILYPWKNLVKGIDLFDKDLK